MVNNVAILYLMIYIEEHMSKNTEISILLRTNTYFSTFSKLNVHWIRGVKFAVDAFWTQKELPYLRICFTPLS